MLRSHFVINGTLTEQEFFWETRLDLCKYSWTLAPIKGTASSSFADLKPSESSDLPRIKYTLNAEIIHSFLYSIRLCIRPIKPMCPR
jgi:hypothetical protein